MLLFGRFYSPDKQFTQPSFIVVVIRVVIAVGFGNTNGRAQRQTSGNNVALRWRYVRAPPWRTYLICDGKPICLGHENVQCFNTELNISSISMGVVRKGKKKLRQILYASVYSTSKTTGLNVDDSSWPPVHPLRGTRQTSTTLHSLSLCRYRPVITARSWTNNDFRPRSLSVAIFVARFQSVYNTSAQFRTVAARFDSQWLPRVWRVSRFARLTDLPSFALYPDIDCNHTVWLCRMSK